MSTDGERLAGAGRGKAARGPAVSADRAVVLGGGPEANVLLLHTFGSRGSDMIALAPAWQRALPEPLFLSAGSAMRSNTDTQLKIWALKVKERRDYSRAKTALGRKLATVMLAMWKLGEPYKPYP